MNKPDNTLYYYPNKMGRIILQSLEEVMGRSGVITVLDEAHMAYLIDNYPPNNLERQFGFVELSYLQAALEKIYGTRGGHGLAQRSGRVCVKYGLKEFGPLAGITKMSFRLLPLPMKLRQGIHSFAHIFNEHSDQRVRVEEEPNQFLWNIERCPICWGRHSKSPICHLAVGVLQEAAYWISGGKNYCIEEIHCIAMGDPACTISIDKQPIY